MNDLFWKARQDRDNTEKFMRQVEEAAERGDQK